MSTSRVSGRFGALRGVATYARGWWFRRADAVELDGTSCPRAIPVDLVRLKERLREDFQLGLTDEVELPMGFLVARVERSEEHGRVDVGHVVLVESDGAAFLEFGSNDDASIREDIVTAFAARVR